MCCMRKVRPRKLPYFEPEANEAAIKVRYAMLQCLFNRRCVAVKASASEAATMEVMSVELVGSDANRTEALEQVIDSISQLISVSDRIFESTSARLRAFDERMAGVNAHISEVLRKVDAIRNVSRYSLMFLSLCITFTNFGPFTNFYSGAVSVAIGAPTGI